MNNISHLTEPEKKIETCDYSIEEPLNEDIPKVRKTLDDTEIDPDEHLSEADHLIHNLDSLHQSTGNFKFDQDDKALIISPTASDMAHSFLHPNLYRNLQEISSLDAFAQMRGVGPEWRESYRDAIEDTYVRISLCALQNLSRDENEATVETHFSKLVNEIARCLEVYVCPYAQKNIIVGGLLAMNEYDFRSKVDTYFVDSEAGVCRLATEAKNEKTWPANSLWYRKSRGVQVLSAMYHFNCPTILYTSKQWKMFMESLDRKKINTLPFNRFGTDIISKSSAVGEVGPDLVAVIVICLFLSTKASSVLNQLTAQSETLVISASSDVPSTV